MQRDAMQCNAMRSPFLYAGTTIRKYPAPPLLDSKSIRGSNEKNRTRKLFTYKVALSNNESHGRSSDYAGGSGRESRQEAKQSVVAI